MTDLQMALLSIGGVIVAGVISYNKWQENKARRSLEHAFSESIDDVLMTPDAEDAAHYIDGAVYAEYSAQGQRSEPRFADDVADAAAASTIPPAVEEALVAFVAPPRGLPVDALIDATIPIALEGHVRGEKMLPVIQNLRYVGNKPVHFIGHHINGEWEEIATGGVYQALMVGVQMANRSNPLNELEYSELLMRLRQFTDGINAEPDVPDMQDVVKNAQALHQFIVDHDVQLGMNVQSNGAPWAVNTLVTALTRQGFDLRTDGSLVMQDAEGEILFSLSTNVPQAVQVTDKLTLLLDVPRVAMARDGYGAMVACARALALRLGGKVVDDSAQPLSDAALSDIGDQVTAFYGAMATAEIVAGSGRAMRLFS